MTITQPQAPEGYTLACAVSDLPTRGKRIMELGGRRVLIIVCDQQVFAIEDRCPQTGRSLAHGAVLNCAITSPANGARYCLRSGRYLGGGQSPLQSHWLTRFPVQVVDNFVFVRLPER